MHAEICNIRNHIYIVHYSTVLPIPSPNLSHITSIQPHMLCTAHLSLITMLLLQTHVFLTQIHCQLPKSKALSIHPHRPFLCEPPSLPSLGLLPSTLTHNMLIRYNPLHISRLYWYVTQPNMKLLGIWHFVHIIFYHVAILK